MELGVKCHAPTALPPEKTQFSLLGWVGPRAGLDGCGKSRPHLESIPGLSFP
jgi:hypothetical protein